MTSAGKDKVDKIRQTIIDTLSRETTAIEDRDGNTPLRLLAGNFKKMSPLDGDALGMILALEGLISNPATISGGEEEDYWSLLSRLTQHAPANVDLSRIRNAYQQELLRSSIPDKAKASILLGFVSAGGHLNPYDLRMMLAGVRAVAPITWLEAAVKSRQFDLVRSETGQLLQEKKLPVRSLVLCLDLWSRLWETGAQFNKIVGEWLAVARQHQCIDVEYIEKWLEARGYNGTPSSGNEVISKTGRGTFNQLRLPERVAA